MLKVSKLVILSYGQHRVLHFWLNDFASTGMTCATHIFANLVSEQWQNFIKKKFWMHAQAELKPETTVAQKHSDSAQNCSMCQLLLFLFSFRTASLTINNH